MGDHEHYCAAYSSKDQPHVEGLLKTLADGVAAKEREILEAKEVGEDITAHEVARRLLHRMMAATNRRMHKGFPEMISYILRKPDYYASHSFVPFYSDSDRCALEHAYDSGSTIADHYRGAPRTLFPGRTPLLQLADYEYRPRILDAFPQYPRRPINVSFPL